jgi:hypothetical protein
MFGLMLGLSINTIAQSLRLSGGEVARPGYTSALKIEIVRGEMNGPVRFSMLLPANWKAEAAYESREASVIGASREFQLVWLDFPLKDTVRYTIGLRPPDDAELSPVTLTGNLAYFDANGAMRKVSTASHTFKVLNYFSRYQ